MPDFSPIDIKKTAKTFLLAGIVSFFLVIIGFITGWIVYLGWFLYIGAAMMLVSLYLSRVASKRQ